MLSLFERTHQGEKDAFYGMKISSRFQKLSQFEDRTFRRIPYRKDGKIIFLIFYVFLNQFCYVCLNELKFSPDVHHIMTKNRQHFFGKILRIDGFMLILHEKKPKFQKNPIFFVQNQHKIVNSQYFDLNLRSSNCDNF